MILWRLEGHTPVEEPDVDAWGRWMVKANRHVAITDVYHQRVSTVFLGVDHNFVGPLPILFETMVFPGCHLMDRYATWDEAEAGHAGMVERIKKLRNPS